MERLGGLTLSKSVQESPDKCLRTSTACSTIERGVENTQTVHGGANRGCNSYIHVFPIHMLLLSMVALDW